MFFTLSSWAIATLLVLAVVGPTVLGLFAGGRLRGRFDGVQESLGVLQAATLGIVGLLLAFGLTLAIERYETRRAVVVAEANAIGTTWLRAQTLDEPQRSRSLPLFPEYTDLAIRMSGEVPGSDAMDRTAAGEEVLQRRLWSLAARALRDAPQDSAPRLYVDSLNGMIDQQGVRVAALNNRVPDTVLFLEVAAAAIALGLLAVYLAFLGRGQVTVLFASLLVTILLFVTFDLDRPTRGLVTVPDTPYVSLRSAMDLPPAAR